MKFTTTNVVLFLAISFVLVLFLYSLAPPTPSDHCGKWGKCAEGYANNNDSYPSLNVYIVQIYDTLYLDTTSGNVLDITVSSASSSLSPASASLSPAPAESEYTASIKQVYDRTGGNSINVGATYSVDGTTVARADNGKADTTPGSYSDYTITTADNVQMFYIPWSKDTYIHAIELGTSPPQSISTMFLGNGDTELKRTQARTPIGINSSTYSSDSHDLSLFIHETYSRTRMVFQICTNVAYDPVNGSLLTTLDRGINVYERVSQVNGLCNVPTPYYIPVVNNRKSEYSPKTKQIADVGFCAWTIELLDLLVLYIGNGKNTVVVVFNKKTNATSYSIVNVGRFFSNGTYDDGSSSNLNNENYSDNNGDYSDDEYMNNFGNNMPPPPPFGIYGDINIMNPYGMQGDGNPLSDYYRWVEYWNQVSGNNLYNSPTMNDYMLKSQIVPPVCPQCPMCSSENGVCNNCGGRGGSGTLKPGETSAPKISEADELKSLIRDTGSGITSLLTTTETNLKSILENTGSGLKDLLQETGSGIKDVAEDAAGGIKDVAYDAAGGVKDVAYDAVGGVKDAAVDVLGEVKDVAYDAVGGVVGQANKLGAGIERVIESNPLQLNGKPNQQLAGPYSNSVVGQDQNPPNASNYAGYVAATNQMTPQGADHLSYFGALTPKDGGSNYIPVMSDFSAFAR